MTSLKGEPSSLRTESAPSEEAAGACDVSVVQLVGRLGLEVQMLQDPDVGVRVRRVADDAQLLELVAGPLPGVAALEFGLKSYVLVRTRYWEGPTKSMKASMRKVSRQSTRPYALALSAFLILRIMYWLGRGFYGRMPFLPPTSFSRLLRHAEGTLDLFYPGVHTDNGRCNGT